MNEFQTVGPLDQFPADQGVLFRSGPHQVALFRHDDQVYAIDNVCPHAGASLADGYTDGLTVACPWHCWEFEIPTGKCITVEGMDVESMPIVIEDGIVKIQLPA